jgi:hypothetical protein
LRETATGLYNSLPASKQERRQYVRDFATQVCDTSGRIPTGAKKADIRAETYRVEHSVDLLNSHLDAGLNSRSIGKQMSSVRKGTATLSKYTPVIGSYNNFYNASCAVKQGQPGSYEDFYIQTTALTTELVLVQQQAYYQTAFAATRTASTKLSLMKLRHVCGSSCYSFSLHSIHWAVRGKVAQAPEYVAETATEYDISLPEAPTLDPDLNRTFAKTYPSVVAAGGDLTANVTDAVSHCAGTVKEESEGLLGQAEDAFNSVREGEVSVDDVVKEAENTVDGVKSIDWSEVPSDVKDDIEGCLTGYEK